MGRGGKAQVGYTKGGKEKIEEERRRKIPRSQKGGGIRGLFQGQGSEYHYDILKKNICYIRPSKVNRFDDQFLVLG